MKTKFRSYTFRVVIEPDEDRWVAYSPALKTVGGATWGYTKEEALKNIQEVIEMVIEDMLEHHEEIPRDVAVSDEPLVTVTK